MKKHTSRSILAVSVTGLLVAIALMSSSKPASATDADIRAGVSPDADAVSIGGGVLTDVGYRSGWYFNPNVELAFGNRRDQFSMNGDFHYDLRNTSPTSVWVGAGPALLWNSREFGGSNTDVGMNVLTGIGAKNGEVRPFAQVRGTMANDNRVSIAGGVRF